MENARALAESARIKLAAIVATGVIALGASGCTNPSETEPTKLTSAPTFEASPGAADLPRVAEHIFTADGSYEDRSVKTFDLGIDPNRSEEDYDWHINMQPDDEEHESLPSGPTAPILDIKLRPDGSLGYKDHTPQHDGPGKQETKLLKAVDDNKDLVEAAMQGGTLDGIYFRLYPPDYKVSGEMPQETMLFISSDYTNDKEGERSVYYYLPANTDVDLEAMSLILGHETAHAVLGQGRFERPSQPKEKATFAAACQTLRRSTLREAADNKHEVLGLLNDMKHYYSAKKFTPAYNAVIRAIENDTFGTLPSHPNLDMGGVRHCTLQNPWQAFMQQVRNRNINSGKPGKEIQTEEFEVIINDMVKKWHKTLMNTSIQQALTEDSYLSEPPLESRFGGSYENQSELTAITLNLTLRVPEAYGTKVAQLPSDQKTALLSVTEANRDKVKSIHPNNARFHRYVDTQYEEFLAAAHRQ